MKRLILLLQLSYICLLSLSIKCSVITSSFNTRCCPLIIYLSRITSRIHMNMLNLVCIIHKKTKFKDNTFCTSCTANKGGCQEVTIPKQEIVKHIYRGVKSFLDTLKNVDSLNGSINKKHDPNQWITGTKMTQSSKCILYLYEILGF